MRGQILIFSVVVMFVGCDQRAWFQKFVPEEEDSFARGLIESIRQNQYELSEGMIDPNVRPEFTKDAFQQMRTYLNRGDPVSIETVGAQINVQENGSRSALTYQIQLSDSWMLAEVVIDKIDTKLSVVGVHFEPIAASLAETNGFTFKSKSLGHYAFFVIQLLVLGFSIYVAALARRSIVKLRWLWVIVALVGIVQVNLNWTTGELDFRTIDIRIPVAGAMRTGKYAPWIFYLNLPVGAIVFLAKRGEIERQHKRVVEESDSDTYLRPDT